MTAIIETAIAEIAVKNLVSRGYQQLKSVVDLEFQVTRLQNTRTLIEATLIDADSVPEQSRALQHTLEKLTFELDRLIDLLDARATRVLQKEVMDGSRLVKEARLFFSASNQLVVRFRDAQKFKDIRKKLDFITRDHAQLGSIICFPSARQIVSCHSITDVVIGRDRDRDNIVSILCDGYAGIETTSVASIVGIGGAGKTTLAWYVYNDDKVKCHFDVQFWVSATQDFDLKEVLREMGVSYHQIFQAIYGRKFLLVLDNIWDQQGLRVKWLELKRLLTIGANGSKFLITTRSKTVAAVMDSVNPYMLGDLTEHDSWVLFQQIAFTQSQEAGVETIGKEIVYMCPKVPLVIRSIGGHLAEKHTLQQWQAFRDDQLANFSSYGNDVIQTLKLSYDQLDKRLKLCVAYCSLFPKGFEYDKDEMVRLWISLGYVEPQYKNQSLEEAGETYMLSLVNYGFFKLKRSYGFDSRGRLTMHDVMHDLVLSIAGFKYKMADSDMVDFDKRVRHVSFGCTLLNTSWEVPSSLFRIEHLQSFLLALPMYSKLKLKNLSTCDRLIMRFKSLRILDLHKLGIKNVPRSLGDMVCLRYLNLSRNPIAKLPNSITRLVNLLSLDLSWCSELRELPKDVSNLVKLRYLYINGCDVLSHMPRGLGKLTNLRTLDVFILREQSLHNGLKANDSGELAELNHLNNLERILTVKVFGRWKEVVSDAKTAYLKGKDKLTALDLKIINGSAKDDERLIENLQPNANLRNLSIEGYRGESLPSWMMHQLEFWLPNLVQISLFNCEGCLRLCSFGRLPRLKLLRLRKLDNVEYVEGTSGGNYENSSSIMVKPHTPLCPLFPSLEGIQLLEMPKLKGWHRISRLLAQDNLVEREQAFPRLKEMHTDNMEHVISLTREFQGMYFLEYLLVYNCDEDVKAIHECIANFSHLKVFTLGKCSRKLQERCLKPTGEDWPKIQHIPVVNIC